MGQRKREIELENVRKEKLIALRERKKSRDKGKEIKSLEERTREEIEMRRGRKKEK